MKKLLAVILAAALVLGLAACSSGSSSGSAPAAASAADMPDSNTSDAADQADTAGGPPPEDQAAEEEQIQIEETVLADEADFRITATSITYSNGNNPVLNVTLENKSDRTLEFTTESNSVLTNTVNGYDWDKGFYEEVDPGQSVETEYHLGGGGKLGIQKIAEIQIGISVRDSETYDSVANVQSLLQTSAAADYDYSEESFQKMIQDAELMERYGMTMTYFNDNVGYDCCGVRVLTAAIISDERIENNEPALYLEVENTTDENLIFYCKAMAVNGLYGLSGIESAFVPAGKKSVCRTGLSDLVREDTAATFGVTDIGTLTICAGITRLDEFGSYSPDDTIGYSSFTVPVSEAGDAGYSYESMKEVMNEAGVQMEAISLSYEDQEAKFLFVVLNNSGHEITIDCGYDDKLNGSEIFLHTWGLDMLPDGAVGVMSISGFDDMGIVSSAEDIKNLEADLVITDAASGDTLLETVLSIDY